MQYKDQPGSKLGEEPSCLVVRNNLLAGVTKRRPVWLESGGEQRGERPR